MDIEQRIWTAEDGWQVRSSDDDITGDNVLVTVFGSRSVLEDGQRWREIRDLYPGACIVGCTTGGEILGEEVFDDSVVVTATTFDTAKLRHTAVMLDTVNGAERAAGEQVARALADDDIKLVFLLSDGTRVNGTELVGGCRAVLGDRVVLTGGLAGDGAAFETTLVGVGDDAPAAGRVAAVGFYGDGLSVRHGTFGGWDKFGPERRITRSDKNVLYELDGEPALDLYKRYLGEEAAGLPGSALLFPLAIRVGDNRELVRTVVGVDESARTMTFAGDIPEGAVAQLMRGHFDHLIEGAELAAEQASGNDDDDNPQGNRRLAILISCIGRKLLLGHRIPDEVEACADVLGPDTVLTGFYSYGELSPLVPGGACQLHNQTMTITTLSEA